MCADLLEPGDGVHELDVQLGVVLGQRLMPVVADELHHRAEGQRVREAVLAVAVVDLYQLVVPPFPEKTQGFSSTLSSPQRHSSPVPQSPDTNLSVSV